jgi:phosphoenolpyruvate carboxykinase (GTP)
VENLFGYTPRYEDLSWTGFEFSRADFERITSIDPKAWGQELELHADLFARLRHHLPAELTAVKSAIQEKLAA